MNLGTYTLIKNEASFIGAHLMSWLSFVDQMVFYDGNSNDGTIEIIETFIHSHPLGKKIILVKDKDPKNLQDDYVKLFNEAIKELSTDFCIFLHPDMFRISGTFDNLGDLHAYTTTKISYAGDSLKDQIYRISEGRTDKWKDVMRLNNPDLGLHYGGHYGADNEDTYFEAITGSEHVLHKDFSKYPYEIGNSGIIMAHFSDIRHYGRRLSRMMTCLMNQGYSKRQAEEMAPNHPRVSLLDGNGFKFVPEQLPSCFTDPNTEYEHFMRSERYLKESGSVTV